MWQNFFVLSCRERPRKRKVDVEARISHSSLFSLVEFCLKGEREQYRILISWDLRYSIHMLYAKTACKTNILYSDII